MLIEEIYSIDFLINDSIILNINGPSHYFSDLKTLNNKTLNKSVVLESFGYDVINFNLFDYTNNTFINKNDFTFIKTFFEDFLLDFINKKDKVKLKNTIKLLDLN